jgi:hypothetical protein
MFEAALLQRGLPFVSAVEVEGYESQLSLISDGVGLGLMMPQVLRSSVLRRHLKQVKVKDFSLMQNVWILHCSHIGWLRLFVACEMRSSSSSDTLINVILPRELVATAFASCVTLILQGRPDLSGTTRGWCG